ncbi:BON domain-containing protein [Bordetella sp. 15P40C-2]|uniref:BON domain-containing protein n=1 Tax=Bordetella sp. 15P40C-2 TaxID=2572246 RepID=UPI001325B7BD|nr:BON domain-containing protein [Bordetella sp. 15P40C-2]MVW71801.1 BON domain-containing protein [Bordetella sp. 15P40C-2]
MKTKKLLIAAAISTGTLLGSLGTAAYAANGDTQKQSAGEFASDAMVTTKVKGAFVADSALSALDIAVETNDGVVTLTGTVGTAAEVEQAGRVARDVEGVKQVKNDIKVDASKADKK